MKSRPPVTLDMTPDGSFRAEPAPVKPAWAIRLGVGAAIVAVGASLVVVAALLLWLASILIPVAIVAGVVAYIALRVHVARLRRQAGPARGGIFRP